MKVAMITSWWPRWCGIATYSLGLCEALRDAGASVTVVCHVDGRSSYGFEARPVIAQHDARWPELLDRVVRDLKPEVVHVQHEFGLYGTVSPEGEYDFTPAHALGLLPPIFRWVVGGLAVVVTYHSVFSRLTWEEAAYYRLFMDLATANIVHEPYQKEALPANLKRQLDNVFACRHGAGTWKPSREEVEEVRHRLGVWGRPVAGLMGWWEPNKDFERVIRLWPAVLERVPSAVLVVAGDARPHSPTGPGCKEALLRAIAQSPARDSIKVVMGRFERLEYLRIMSCFDFLILPYSHASQSGNQAHAYQVGIPCVVTPVEGLAASVEASRAGLIASSDDEMVEAIARLLRDEELRKCLGDRARRFVEQEIAWPLVADRHLQIYQWARRRAASARSGYVQHRVHV